MPGLIAPTGPINLPLFRGARLLCACPTFRALMGAATPTEAYERVHFRKASDVPHATREHQFADPLPRAIVDDGQQWRSDRIGANTWRAQGEIEISLEVLLYRQWDQWPEGFWPVGFWPEGFWWQADQAEEDGLTAFANKAGAILREIMDRSGGQPSVDDLTDPDNATLLNVELIQQSVPVVASVPADESARVYYGAVAYRFSWR